MAVPRVLLSLPLLLLQGGFPGATSDSVALKEGENLNLHCTFSNENSTLQWLNPRGFTIFLNAQRVLRDQRYKLLRYSKGELSIQLSNVTVQDEGIYSCFYYSRHFKSKRQNVEILAAPSHPVLEVSQDAGRGIKLSCSTQGCKPRPQISWLLDNGIELPGDTRHQLGADGKKWSTSSTLRILSYSPRVTASCIIQHPALGPERLTASLRFQDLPSPGWEQPTRPAEDAEVPSPSENPEVSSTPENPAYTSPSGSPKAPEVSNSSASPKAPGVDSSFASPEVPEVSSPSASPENPAISSSAATPAQPNLTDVASLGTETSPAGNGTQEEPPRTEAPAPRENVTVISTLIFEQNPKSEGRVKKEKNLLLPILVAALIFVLLIIVLLFMVKLKKAHGVWKRENDVSEQTLESYKSRSNEDSPGHEKNGQAAHPKSNMQYVTEGQVETPEKNPETPARNLGDKTMTISEEMLKCRRETDV